MKIIKILLSATLLSMLMIFASCDKVEDPLKEQTGSCGDENGPVPIKKILVEDYTGHLCGNCPRAAEELTRLKSVYCDHIIPIAIHTGFFARPYEGYPEDFRTETGDAFDAVFGATNLGLPKGVINRTEYEGVYPLSHQSLWQAAIEQQLSVLPDAGLVLTNSYDSASRTVSIELSVEFFSDISNNIHVSLLLAEDSIIAPQTDYAASPQKIENYVHRHVLRSNINGIWGESLTDNASAGDMITKNFSAPLDTAWRAEHCEIIAFIYHSETKEIIQAESEPIFRKTE